MKQYIEKLIRLGYAVGEAEYMVKTMSVPQIEKQLLVAQKSLTLIKETKKI